MTADEREALIDLIISNESSLGAFNDKGFLVACFSHRLGREVLLDIAAECEQRGRAIELVAGSPGDALFRKHSN